MAYAFSHSIHLVRYLVYSPGSHSRYALTSQRHGITMTPSPQSFSLFSVPLQEAKSRTSPSLRSAPGPVGQPLLKATVWNVLRTSFHVCVLEFNLLRPMYPSCLQATVAVFVVHVLSPAHILFHSPLRQYCG